MARVGGSAISLKDEQSEKACCPITVRVGGSVISLKDVHSHEVPRNLDHGDRDRQGVTCARPAQSVKVSGSTWMVPVGTVTANTPSDPQGCPAARAGT